MAQMQTAAKALRPQPESCDEGVRWLEGQYGLPAKQAQKLASRVFVTQCAAAPTERYAPAPPSAAVAAPAEASLPPPVVSIDEQYNRRVAAECARGLFGVVCRDRIKNELCKGRFSNQPPPGETRCKQGLQQDSRDH
ncbi:hypothetical protein [Chitinimonas sp.]|uniref:hypothetical protein n=1 Tax=Chitinimonas sp. TaxID=1934313 RepID=UPI002F94834F